MQGNDRSILTHPTRHGIALLMVLAAVVVVLAALGAGLAAVRHGSAEAVLARDELRIEALRADAEALLHTWCAVHGAAIWTPSQDPHQAWLLLDDVAHLGETEARVTLLVWDALAGVPLAVPEARVALRQALPPQWQELQLAADAAPPIPLLDQLAVEGGLRRFPPLGELPPARAWTLGTPPPEPDPPPLLDAGEPVPTAALLLAPHSDGRLNLRTAPGELLAAALRERRRGGALDALLPSRDAGEIPSLPADLARGDEGLRLVTETDRWQALLRVRVAATERRWWLICAGTDEGVATLQRHAVGE